MASFADYPTQSMPTSGDDFTLYPYSDIWDQNQAYLPPSTFQDQPYLNSTSIDPCQQYSQPQFNFNANPQYHQSKQQLQPPSPSYSPSNSASHSFDHYQPPVLSSTSDSVASGPSSICSATGSPAVQPHPSDWQQQGLNMFPNIVQTENISQNAFAATGFEMESMPVSDKACVDPSLIQPFSPTQYTGTQFPEQQAMLQSSNNLQFPAPPSPAPSRLSPRMPSGKAPSPFPRQQGWQPYPSHHGSRRPSVSSIHSRQSQGSITSDDSNKGLCPIPSCGKHFKDLKAHMLTHQNERPEKCPIPTCEYHVKGFARKYDKNRHTLTHYKGTMVCGFCPGSGSAAEKSFNRADVFKRHLTSVHGVEQTPPNSRKKSPTVQNIKKQPGSHRDVSGMCSTCGVTFANAQDFYEHLDDCVLRVVQQADPCEAINETLLTSVADDNDVKESLERHMLPTTIDFDAPTTFNDGEEEEDEGADEDEFDGAQGGRSGRSGKGSIKSRKNGTDNLSSQSAQSRGAGTHLTSGGAVSKPTKKGLTYSKNGVPLAGPLTAKGSKRRKNYPLSWGAPPTNMKMKKRVLCVYEGQRRLWKDDMMLDAEHEVRIPLPNVGDGRAWVTDLDIQTLRRAEGILNATEEEKGPYLPDDEPIANIEQLMQ